MLPMDSMNPVPLIRAARIRGRVRQLGRELAGSFAGPVVGNLGRVPAIVALLDGSFCFVADLVRAIPVPDLRLHFARAASYHGGTESSGSVALHALPNGVGADVLVVDDILDTGRTLAAVVAALKAGGAARVRTCVLLDKPARRQAGRRRSRSRSRSRQLRRLHHPRPLRRRLRTRLRGPVPAPAGRVRARRPRFGVSVSAAPTTSWRGRRSR